MKLGRGGGKGIAMEPCNKSHSECEWTESNTLNNIYTDAQFRAEEDNWGLGFRI